MINNDNIELYIFRYKEGLLNPDEREAVEQALAAHPEWQELADLYDPGMKISSYPEAYFAEKASLRSEVMIMHSRKKVVSLWPRIAVAASLLILITVGIRLFWDNTPDDTDSGTIVATNINEQIPAIDTIKQETILLTPIKTKRNKQTHIKVEQPAVTESCEETPLIAEALSDSPTIKVTDQLIKYLDDDETFEEINRPVVTVSENLITYLEPRPEPKPFLTFGSMLPRPEWTYPVEDWFNGIRLAYIERQTLALGHINTMLSELTN